MPLLSFTMQRQEQSQWCWSAVSVSVDHYFNSGSSWKQCTMANAELTQTGCCRDGSTSGCNKPWFLERALARAGRFRRIESRPTSLGDLIDEFAAGRPVGVRIGWAGGGGHFVTITGYEWFTVPMYWVQDPIYGTSLVPAATLESAYQGSGSWTHTYFV